MERLPKGIYTPEFRAEAVKLVEAEGLSVDAAAKRLSVPKSSLCNWVRASRAGKLAKVGQGMAVPGHTLSVPIFRSNIAFDEIKEHTPPMLSSTHNQRVLDLASQKGLLRASDLDAISAPRVVLTRLTAAGLLEKVGRGLYRLPDAQVSEFESLGTIATKVPQAVFCLLTALQFHELTTQLPRQIWIAMPRGSHPPRVDYPPVKMVQFTGDAYSAGIEEVERDGVRLRVYGVAKTVADCFKHRNKIGLDVALEALKDARARSKASVDDIWRFAKICRVANVMRPYLEAGRLVARRVARPERNVRVHYAWGGPGFTAPGRALQWWLNQLQSPATRRALLENHHHL